MGDKESSDEEDVFECGRCKEKFTDMTIFMSHKKDKSCQKLKKQTSATSNAGNPLENSLATVAEAVATSPMKDNDLTPTANLSPSISDIFSSKTSSKGTESSSLELFSVLDQVSKPLQESGLVECALCQEWYPNQTILDHHLKDKHGLISQADIAQLEKQTIPENTASEEKVTGDNMPTGAELPRKKSSRRTRADHSCNVCNLKFLSKFKLEQHTSGRKHRSNVKRQTLGDGSSKAQKRPDRRAKQGICPICSMPTQSLKELNNHFKEEHGDYKGKENKSSRVKGKHGDSSKKLCRECGALVPTRSLKRHERRCANRKLFECPLCKHQSREKTDFHYHVDSHKVWIESPISEGQLERLEPSKKKGSGEQTEVSEADEGDHRTTTITLSAADLAVLGLMPKQQTLEECFDTLAPGFKKGCALDQVVSDKEKSEGEDTNDFPSEGANASGSVKIHPRQLKCKLCVKWFVRNDLTKHMLDKHSMVKQFQCRDLDCLETFTDMDMFKDHIASHSNKLMFQCGCRHCLPNRGEVEGDYPEGMRKWKMRQYYSQLSFKCNICWVKFPSEGRLLRHKQIDPHRHVCDKCGKVSVSKRQLRLHKLVHVDTRGYLCDMCGSGFKTDRDLRRHIASHSSERPFVCTSCGKSFIFKNKLTRHCNTVHATKKTHKCDQPNCKKSFARKDKLKEHLNTHKNIPPYVCKYCKKAFFRKDSAKDHEILAHTKEYPYSCRVCNKGFIRPKILENHETVEHGKPSETASLLKLVKVQSDEQQHSRITIPCSVPGTASNPALSYVIYDQNIGSVLQGQTDSETQSLQTLQSMAFPTPNNEATSNELSYQMSEMTGNAASGLAYQMTSIGLTDSQNPMQVTLTSALAPTDGGDTV